MARLLMPYTRQDAMTFSDLRVAVAKELAFQEASPLTIDQYDVCYGQFFTFIKARGLLDDIKHFNSDVVREFIHQMKAEGAGANTLRNKLSALRTMAKIAMTLRDRRDKPRLTHDPTATFAWPKQEHRESKYLYPPELKAVWDAPCSPALAIARELLIDTGARVSSLVNAKVEAIQEAGGAVGLLLTVKGGKQKLVPLSTPAAKALRDSLWARGMPDADERLIVRDNGQPWTRTALSEAIVRLAKAAGITRLARVSAHKLRHTNSVFGRGAGLDAETRGPPADAYRRHQPEVLRSRDPRRDGEGARDPTPAHGIGDRPGYDTAL